MRSTFQGEFLDLFPAFLNQRHLSPRHKFAVPCLALPRPA